MNFTKSLPHANRTKLSVSLARKEQIDKNLPPGEKLQDFVDRLLEVGLEQVQSKANLTSP